MKVPTQINFARLIKAACSSTGFGWVAAQPAATYTSILPAVARREARHHHAALQQWGNPLAACSSSSSGSSSDGTAVSGWPLAARLPSRAIKHPQPPQSCVQQQQQQHLTSLYLQQQLHQHHWRAPSSAHGALVSLASAAVSGPLAVLLGSPSGAAAARSAPWQLQQHRSLQLVPKRTPYRKAFKSMGFNETIVPNSRQLAYGLYGVYAKEHARIPASTLEAVRRVLRRTIKKTAMVWVRVTPNVPVTKKPAEVRMGKGKGAVDFYAAAVRPGQILFEIDNLPRQAAVDAVAAVQPKMPIRVGFVEWK